MVRAGVVMIGLMGCVLCRIGRAHRGLRGDHRRRADRAAPGAKRRAEASAEDGGGRLFCFAMQRPLARRKIAGLAAIAARAACRRSPSRRPWARSSPAIGRGVVTDLIGVDGSSNALPIPVVPRAHEAGDILRCELDPHRCPEGIEAKRARSSLKSPSRGDNVIASIPAASARRDQIGHRAIASRIGVAGDVEPTQRRREQHGGEMRGRERGRHRHGREDASERQHGFDAFARAMISSPPHRNGRHCQAGRPWLAAACRSALCRVDVIEPAGSSQVRCTPVILPSRSVTRRSSPARFRSADLARADSSNADETGGFRFRCK